MYDFLTTRNARMLSRATESNIKLISKCENSTSQFPALMQQVVFMESISLEGIEANVAFMCVISISRVRSGKMRDTKPIKCEMLKMTQYFLEGTQQVR